MYHSLQVASLVQAGQLKSVVDSVHEFNEQGCAKAFLRQQSRRAVGKIVVDVFDGATK